MKAKCSGEQTDSSTPSARALSAQTRETARHGAGNARGASGGGGGSRWKRRAVLFAPKVWAVLIVLGVAVFLRIAVPRLVPYPKLPAFLEREYSVPFFDAHGTLLQVSAVEDGLRREFTPLAEIPAKLQDFFLKAEDSRFYWHGGVDVLSLCRALFQNVTARRGVSGASTITMQLARVISPRPERTLTAKAGECFRAMQLEARLGKKRILELYLNNVPFGNNVEGVTSAARYFFGKELAALSTEEMALLAVIPRRPEYYSPVKFPEHAARAAEPLLAKHGKPHAEVPAPLFNALYNAAAAGASPHPWLFLAPHAVSQAKTELAKLGAAPHAVSQAKTELAKLGAAPHAVSQVRAELAAAQQARTSPGAGAPRVADAEVSGKLSARKKAALLSCAASRAVRLTIDAEIQRLAEYELSTRLEWAKDSRIENGAVIVLENESGRVLALVGSNNWFDDAHGGQINGVLVPNQMGSSMKPFLYAAALEEKLLEPAAVLPDIPLEFGSERLYLPQNFNNRYNGPVLLRTSLASSLNVPAVLTLSRLGVETYRAYLNRLDFASLDSPPARDADLGLALGAGEVTLWELTHAFTVFARDGVLVPLHLLDTVEGAGAALGAVNSSRAGLSKIQAASGVAGTNGTSSGDGGEPAPVRVFSADTARIIADILSDKAARVSGFGHTQSFETSYPSIFKTGTANQYQNIVAVGGTTRYTVGVWMGNFSGNTVVGKTGSSLPASTARTILDYLVERDEKNGVPCEPFPQPEQYEKRTVCSLSGMAPGPYCPHTVQEFFRLDDGDPPCTWHKQGTSGTAARLTLPAEYQEWALSADISALVDYKSSPLTITTPADGSVFYASGMGGGQQRIPVRVTGGRSVSGAGVGSAGAGSAINTDTATQDALTAPSTPTAYDTLTVYYDAEVFTVERPFSFHLPVERGEHTLTVSLGSEEQRITFIVK